MLLNVTFIMSQYEVLPCIKSYGNRLCQIMSFTLVYLHYFQRICFVLYFKRNQKKEKAESMTWLDMIQCNIACCSIIYFHKLYYTVNYVKYRTRYTIPDQSAPCRNKFYVCFRLFSLSWKWKSLEASRCQRGPTWPTRPLTDPYQGISFPVYYTDYTDYTVHNQ